MLKDIDMKHMKMVLELKNIYSMLEKIAEVKASMKWGA